MDVQFETLSGSRYELVGTELTGTPRVFAGGEFRSADGSTGHLGRVTLALVVPGYRAVIASERELTRTSPVMPAGRPDRPMTRLVDRERHTFTLEGVDGSCWEVADTIEEFPSHFLAGDLRLGGQLFPLETLVVATGVAAMATTTAGRAFALPLLPG